MKDIRGSIGKVFIALFVGCSISAMATISVEWGVDGTIYRSDGVTPLPTGSILQLIWSVDALISTPPAGSNYLIPTDGEVLLKQITLASDGSFYDGSTTYDELDYDKADTNYFVGGYVYTRVFDQLGSGTPTNDTWFGDGPASLTLVSGSQHVTPKPLPVYTDITGGESFTLNQQVVIPEPTTMAIMGIGLLTLVSRRFRRK